MLYPSTIQYYIKIFYEQPIISPLNISKYYFPWPPNTFEMSRDNIMTSPHIKYSHQLDKKQKNSSDSN